MKVFKNILLTLAALLVLLVVLAFFLGVQLLFVTGGAWLAMTVAGWFGWFAGVGWGTYFAIAVCFWAFTIIVGFPTVGKRAFINRLYAQHKIERRERRKSSLENFSSAFNEMVEAQFGTKK